MSQTQNSSVISEDLSIIGEVRGSAHIEVLGFVDGKISADNILIRESGRVIGTLRADNAEIEGAVEGDIGVKNLIRIKSTGSVTGDVQYGSLALAEGGNLSASVRNIPPTLYGDFSVSVGRGSSVRLTTADINAADPDDTADNLTFAVSSLQNGFISHGGAPTVPIQSFTLSDLAAGTIGFVHDGGASTKASFDVVVSDDDGATSGPPRTVNISVVAA